METLDSQTQEIRRFSRFYTQKVGILGDAFLGTQLALPAARIIYEIGMAGRTSAADLARDLALDPGYVSRLVKGLDAQGRLRRTPSPDDRRATILSLTEAGYVLFRDLDARSSREIAGWLLPLAADQRRKVARALAEARTLLGGPPPPPRSYLIRPHRPGDGGWIVSTFALSLIEDHGLGPGLEALVGDIVVDFLRSAPHPRQHCWIAEVDGVPAGSVMLIEDTPTVAKLRLLVVTPAARGLGIGRSLVAECLRFARASGYAHVRLWTYACLTGARRIYAEAGFRCVEAVPAIEFGVEMVNETWELDLNG